MTSTTSAEPSRASQRAFFGVSALLFAASAAVTIVWCASMPAMGEMPMPGRTWIHAAAGFMGTWVVMMMAMMLPSLVPVLWRRTRPGGATALVGAGYFLVWAIYGAVAYALGLGVTTVELRWPALASVVPAATGVVVLLAGWIQLTGWKARQLGRCWETLCGESPLVSARSAWRQGLRLGVRCCLCCSGYMILLLVTGMMQLGVMTLVAASIAVERVAPRPGVVARAAGVVITVTGVVLIVRALTSRSGIG